RYVDGRRNGIDPEFRDELLRVGPGVGAGEAGERMLLAFVTESLLCWDDGTLRHPDDGDVAATLGIGFPAGLGGPFHWVDRQGSAAYIKRCDGLGPAFAVADSWRRMAADGSTFAAQERR